MRANGFFSRALVLALPLAAAVAIAAPTDARAQEVVVGFPPPSFVVTAQPEYYEGHPAYWYNNHWYYRDVRGWHYYRGEPAYLRDRREHWAHHPRPRYHYHR